MLLRSSRQASYLTKQALLGRALGAGARLAGKVGAGALGTAGRLVQRYPRAALGGVVGGSAAAIEVGEGLRRARVGMTPQWQAARRLGYVQEAMPKGTMGRFNFMKNRRELARQMRIL